MTRFHWLKLRATAHATEVPDRVRAAMQFVSGLDEEGFDTLTEAERIDSHHGGEVWSFETTVKRAAEIRAALTTIHTSVADLVDEIDWRTDDDGVFYLRFDKQAALQGRLETTRGDDAVQVRMKPEVHPAGRERAMAAMQAWFSGD